MFVCCGAHDITCLTHSHTHQRISGLYSVEYLHNVPPKVKVSNMWLRNVFECLLVGSFNAEWSYHKNGIAQFFRKKNVSTSFDNRNVYPSPNILPLSIKYKFSLGDRSIVKCTPKTNQFDISYQHRHSIIQQHKRAKSPASNDLVAWNPRLLAIK